MNKSDSLQTVYKTLERNRHIPELYEAGLTMPQIGKIYGITKARVSQIIKRFRNGKTCSFCYYYVPGPGHCLCREPIDMVKTPGECSDWRKL